MSVSGYDVNMRRDNKTGEYLAFMPRAYVNRHGERYYMAYTLIDGWVELSPAYATSRTHTVIDYPAELKRAVDRNLGYLLIIAPRLASA